MTLTLTPPKKTVQVLPSRAAKFDVPKASGTNNVNIYPLTNYTFGHWFLHEHHKNLVLCKNLDKEQKNLYMIGTSQSRTDFPDFEKNSVKMALADL